MSKLPSIMIGIDFYRKARNRKWIQDNGAEAVIVLQEVWIASSQERNCRIKKDECAYLPFPVSITPEKVSCILESAVSVGLLDAEGDYYFNSQIVEDQENFQKKQLNYKEARKKRDENPQTSSENPPRILPESSENPPRIILKSEYEQRTVNTEDPDPEKLSDPPEPKPQHVKLGKWIQINDIELESCLMQFGRFGLNPARGWLERAAVLLDFEREKKPEKRHLSASMEIVGWPLKKCLEEQAAGKNAKAAEARLERAKTPYQDAKTQAARVVPDANATSQMLKKIFKEVHQ